MPWNDLFDGSDEGLAEMFGWRDKVDQFMDRLFWMLKCATYTKGKGFKADAEIRATLFGIVKPIAQAELKTCVELGEGNVDDFLNRMFRAVLGHAAWFLGNRSG